MTEFNAYKYLVGGLYTHGGEYEEHVDEQPAGLTRAWDQDDNEWREFTATDGMFWHPIGDDGKPLPDGLELTWPEFLQQFSPVSDQSPVSLPQGTYTRKAVAA